MVNHPPSCNPYLCRQVKRKMLCNESLKTACAASVPALFSLLRALVTILSWTCDVFYNPSFETFSSTRRKTEAAKSSKMSGWWNSAISAQSVLFSPYKLYQLATLKALLLPFPSYSNAEDWKKVFFEMQRSTLHSFNTSGASIFSFPKDMTCKVR